MIPSSRGPCCPRCHQVLPDDPPEGLCPACLITRALGEPNLEEGVEDPSEKGPVFRYFGDYRLEEEIGRGAMGVVFRARQLSLERTVAVKLLLGGFWASPEAVERFRQEAQSAAKLRHPNIVTIHEVGTFQEQPYFSMDYVPGRSLAAKIRRGILEPRPAAELLETLARTVAFAHRHGVVHRDLKPSNIVLSAAGEPIVTDFGLAKKLEAGSDRTGTGILLGTPGYLPPESLPSRPGAGAQGRVVADSKLGDVYSLGAILYFVLVGRPPVEGESVLEVLLQQVASDPESPRKLRPSIPEDLEAICLKCLEREPAGRYGSAGELAEDLEAFLAGRPVQARLPEPAARLRRWLRRNRRGVAAAALTVAVLGVGTAGFRYFSMDSTGRSQQLQEELAARDRRVQEQEVELALERARSLRNGGDRVGALAQIRRAAGAGGVPSRLRTEAISVISLPSVEVRVRHDLDSPRLLEPSRDGSRFAVLSRGPGEGEARLEVRDTGTGEVLEAVSGRAGRAVPFETRLLVLEGAAELRRLVFWDSAAGELESIRVGTEAGDRHQQADYWVLAPSQDLAAGGASEQLFLWRRSSGRWEELPISGWPLGFLDRQLLYQRFESLLLWDPERRASRSPIPGDRKVRAWDLPAGVGVTLEPAAAGGLEAWDLRAGRPIGRSPAAAAEGALYVLSPDGERVAYGEKEGARRVRLWNPRVSPAGDLTLALPRRRLAVLEQAAFSPDGNYLATLHVGPGPASVRVWETRTGRPLADLEGEHRPTWSPTGELVTLGGPEGAVPGAPGLPLVVYGPGSRALDSAAIWRRFSMPLREIPTEDPVRHIAFEASGERLAVDGSLWRLETDGSAGAQLAAGSSGAVERLVFLPGGRVFALSLPELPVARSGPFRLRELPGEPEPSAPAAVDYPEAGTLAPGEELLTMAVSVAAGRRRAVLAAVTQLFARSQDDAKLRSLGSALELWSLEDGRRLSRWPGEGLEGLRTLQLSPDETVLAVGGTRGASLWSFPEGRPIGDLGHGSFPEAFAFQADNRRVFSGGVGEVIEVSDGDGGRHRTWPAGQGSIQALALSPDGTVLASGGEGADIVLWSAEDGTELARWVGHEGGVTALAFHPTAEVLVSGGGAGGAKLWSLDLIRQGLLRLDLAWHDERKEDP